MVDLPNKILNSDSIPIYDPTFLQAIADNEIINYRVRLLSGINYARLLFAGIILWYFYAAPKNSSSISMLFSEKQHDYDHLQLFWVVFSAYILMLLFCNTALMYKIARRWIFIIMALAEISILTSLLALVFTHELANVNMMLILSSLLLSVLTLTYFESIFLALTLGFALFMYLIQDLIRPQLASLITQNDSIGNKLSLLWLTIQQHQFELVNPIIYCASLMLIIVIVGFLASQARDNKILSHLHHLYNNQLRKLNDSIIEDIKSGLIVVNAKGVILTLNQQAKKIFNLDLQAMPPTQLINLSTALANNFNRWLYAQFSDTRTIELGQTSYSIGFDTLQKHQGIDLTLITLESVEESMQRIREARLVSLGRLSAGIAHEIRNPLASIQSAADLLGELTENEQTQFLINKITHNTKRVNIIISDVLNMFNETPRHRALIHLNTELKKIVQQAQQDTLTKEAIIHLELQATDPYLVYFDNGHLSQIINNLIINSITHGGRDNIEVTISSQISKIGRQIYLDISDNGRGVSENDKDKLFEPFFSKRNGTGLGLYLIREMCLANQAQIVFITREKGACFRITMERYLNDELSKEFRMNDNGKSINSR